MLDDAVAAFLESVPERAFDEPLMALIRAEGFSDVHLVHGQREFGKDVIGRKGGEQWAWQSKAGDIGQGEWRDLAGQLDELRLVNLGHGAFDAAMPRRPVLVTTGRLKGNAPDLYRDLNARAKAKGEPELELWTQDTLLAKLSGNPDAVLRGSMDGRLLAVLGSVDETTVSMRSLETFSRRWMAWEPDRIAGLGVIEAALICERLRAAERLDLACHLALCLVRGAWAAGAGGSPASPLAADAAGRLFESYALALWDECDERLLRDRGLVGFSGPSAWVTYQVRCVRIAEIIGLLALRLRDDDPQRSAEMTGWLTSFVAAQPGCARPISDQYAVSLIPAVLTIAAHDEAAARELVKQCTIFVCDQHAVGMFGLAGLDAEPSEEIERLLGSAFESVDLPRLRDSLIATVLLDLCVANGWRELYADVINDVLAARLHPYVIRLAVGPDEYARDGMGNRLDPNVDYAEALVPGELVAPHHADDAGGLLSAGGRSWDLLAVSSALRDRHFYRALLAVAQR